MHKFFTRLENSIFYQPIFRRSNEAIKIIDRLDCFNKATICVMWILPILNTKHSCPENPDKLKNMCIFAKKESPLKYLKVDQTYKVSSKNFVNFFHVNMQGEQAC